jgi:serine/threonine protein kinase
MELFGKDDIEKVLLDPKTKDQIPLFERVRWLKQVAEGMAWIHGAGIVHRDLKPSNILFDQKSRSVKVCDFGLSVLLPKGNKTQLDPKGGFVLFLSVLFNIHGGSRNSSLRRA